MAFVKPAHSLLVALVLLAQPFSFGFTQSQTSPANNPTVKHTLTVITWNACNFGKSKADNELDFFASTLKDADIATLQEISASIEGEKAVGRLLAKLNKAGNQWRFTLSAPTSGDGSERYVYFYKPARVQLVGEAFLDINTEQVVNREPYMARFIFTKDTFLLASMHSVPTEKNPAKDAKQLGMLPNYYKHEKLLVMGDFNLTQADPSWDVIKGKGFLPALKNQKTSLKMKPAANGDVLASEYDNVFYPKQNVTISTCTMVPFYKQFQSLKTARTISDHCPVRFEITN